MRLFSGLFNYLTSRSHRVSYDTRPSGTGLKNTDSNPARQHGNRANRLREDYARRLREDYARAFGVPPFIDSKNHPGRGIERMIMKEENRVGAPMRGSTAASQQQPYNQHHR